MMRGYPHHYSVVYYLDFDWYFDCCLKVNEDYNKIYIYVCRSLYKPPLGYDAGIKLTFTAGYTTIGWDICSGYDAEIKLTFTKQ